MGSDVPEEAQADLSAAFNRLRDRKERGADDALTPATIFTCATAICWCLGAVIRELRDLRSFLEFRS
jgi:hypothetical protein